MSEENDSEQEKHVDDPGAGIHLTVKQPESYGIFLTISALVIGLGGFLGGYYEGKTDHDKTDVQAVAQMQCVKANAEAQKANADAQVAIQKRIGEIQLKVAGDCSAKGRAPRFINGNIDCPSEGK